METIYLTQKEFDDLLEYSISQPTGVTIGKVWKRRNYVFKSPKGNIYNAGWLPTNAELIEDRWFHCKYIKSKKEGYMDTEMKLIVIAGVLEIDKTIKKFEGRNKK